MAFSGAQITRLGVCGFPRPPYGSFDGKAGGATVVVVGLASESDTASAARPERTYDIGLDVDNTIFDLDASTLFLINKLFGTRFTKEDIIRIGCHWYVEPLLQEAGLTEKEAKKFCDRLYRSEDYADVYLASLPIPGSIDRIKALHYDGHRLYALTSRPPGLLAVTEEQFRRVGLDWLCGDWTKDGPGRILYREHGDYWRERRGLEFKIMAIEGSFSDGRYKDFPGLDYHLDDMEDLVKDDLMTPEIRKKIFLLARYPYIDPDSGENIVINWEDFYQEIFLRSIVKGEDFDSVAQS